MLHSLTWETEIFFCGFGSRDLLFSVLALNPKRGGEWLMRDFARPRDLGFSLRARGILTFYVARARL